MIDEQLTPTQIAEERIRDFQALFGGNQFFEDGVVKAIKNTAKLLSMIFGDEISQAGFNLMLRRAFSQKLDSWQEILEENQSGLYSETKIGELLHDLTAYADYGVVLSTSQSTEERHTILAEQIAYAEDFLSILPELDWDLRQEDLLKILNKATARWKIDNDHPISGEEIALLSGRALQTIKNNLGHTGNPKAIMGTLRRIEAKEAIAWLKTISDFHGSIWRQQDDSELIDDFYTVFQAVYFVPIATDGTVFHPGLRRDGFFHIDADGREERLSEFTEALRRLQLMSHPRWKRPTPGGSWTFARGVDWRRTTLEELEALPAS